MDGRNTSDGGFEPASEVPDAVEVGEARTRVRDVAARFGLRLFDPASLTEIADDAVGRSLLVGWNRARLGEPAAPPAVGSRTARAPTAPTRRLPRPPRAARAPGDGSPPTDRWAIVSLVAEGEGLAASETAMLRALASAVEARIAELSAAAAAAVAEDRSLLSRRERECLQWTAAGKTTWEIAGILDLSQNTVDGYIATATRKLGAVNRAQAVAEALRRGLID